MFSGKSRNSWLRRRWFDFRNGHSIYLIFVMTFANFITIQYSLLLDRIPVLNSLFGNIAIFAVVFIAIYVPLGLMIGYWHRKNQLSVEVEAQFRENIIGARLWLFLLDLVEGRSTEEEKKNMRDMLSKIARQPSQQPKGETVDKTAPSEMDRRVI